MRQDLNIKRARDVLKIEAESILDLTQKLDGRFSKAVEMIYSSKGRVIVTGIGKSGLIGRKIVATLTSTGTPAIFLHPVEGMHGDLGIVTREDVILAISNSGETSELNMLIGSLKQLGVPLIGMTGKMNSTLSQCCDVVIDIGVGPGGLSLQSHPDIQHDGDARHGRRPGGRFDRPQGIQGKGFLQVSSGGNARDETDGESP